MTSSPDQGIGDAIRKIVLGRIAAQVRERQHRDRGPQWRKGRPPFKREGEKADQQCSGPRQDLHSRTRPIWPTNFLPGIAGIKQNAIDSNRIGDVLEPLLSQTRKTHIRLVHRVIEGGAGYANAARLV